MSNDSLQAAADFTARSLTMVPDKTRYYVAEEEYRAALRALVPQGIGAEAEASLGRRVQAIGLGLFRPDAIAHDRVGPALDYLRRRGLRPFHAQIADVRGPMVRELWRYQLNAASDERLHLLDLIFEAGSSVLALFHHVVQPPVPCSVLMADVKGPALPSRREGWELRARLRSPSRIEVYFHASDEPADVIREGAIMLGRDRLAQLLRPYLSETEVAWRDATDDVLLACKTVGSVPVTPLNDPLLVRTAEECGLGSSKNDRWAVLRALAERSPMFRDATRNLIRQTGSREWWEQSPRATERASILRSESIDDEFA